MESEKQIFSSFEKIFSKLARRAFNVPELAQLRSESEQIVSAIRAIAEKVALGKCKKLNDAVSFGFTKAGEDIEKIEIEIANIEHRLKTLEDKLAGDGK